MLGEKERKLDLLSNQDPNQKFDMILFVGVMPARTSNLEQAWSTSVVAIRIFPILSANNNNTNKNN